MKPIADMDHYEVPEVPRDASQEEIERAYRMLRATYASDSLASYSVVDDHEAAALLDRVEIAYRVLADEEERQRYDSELRGAAAGFESAETEPVDEPDLAIEFAAEEGALDPDTPDPAVIAAFDEIDSDAGTGFDGARLRRARMLRGLELDRIAQVTKINPTYLRFLEEERYRDLPAAVYVRGFVTAYARCVGLDPARAAAGYMERYRKEIPETRSAVHR